MSRRILFVAYHFPPVHGSSGLQRTLKFTQYLPSFGWEPAVLTIDPRAYERVSEDQLADIPPGLRVERALGFDTARHLAIRKRYFRWMALPDRWVSWIPFAVLRGLRLIREFRPEVILSTSPIVSAHVIGQWLSRISGVPLVADLRDLITEDDYPQDPKVWKVHRRIESNLCQRAARVIFTTPGASRTYAHRYPDLPSNKWTVIENGYDEENFREAEKLAADPSQREDRPLTLVHAGILYPEERNPAAFFEAISKLKSTGVASGKTLRVVLRGTGHDALHAAEIARRGIGDIVTLAPPVAYREALAEMLQADGLLLFQGRSCNDQIPAKMYEYFRTGRPIIALTDRAGDTARALTAAGISSVADLDSVQEIFSLLAGVLGERQVRDSSVDARLVEQFSRRGRTRELAVVLDEVVMSQRA